MGKTISTIKRNLRDSNWWGSYFCTWRPFDNWGWCNTRPRSLRRWSRPCSSSGWSNSRRIRTCLSVLDRQRFEDKVSDMKAEVSGRKWRWGWRPESGPVFRVVRLVRIVEIGRWRRKEIFDWKCFWECNRATGSSSRGFVTWSWATIVGGESTLDDD